MEAKTMRRTLECDISGEGKERLKQILHAAARRLTLTIASPAPSSTITPGPHTKSTSESNMGRAEGCKGTASVRQGSVPLTASTSAARQAHEHARNGTGKGKGGTRQENNTHVMKEPASTRVFELLPSEWPHPVFVLDPDSANFQETQAGIYMLTEGQDAVSLAFRARSSKAPVALVSPKPIVLAGIEPLCTMATLVSIQTTLKGRDRTVQRSTANTEMWVYNISQTCAVTGPLRPLLTMPVAPPKTVVMRVFFPCNRLPAKELLQDPLKLARQEMTRVVGEGGYVDVWNAKVMDDDQLKVQVRMAREKTQPFLKRSGVEDFWVDTPLDEMATTSPIWLSDPTRPLSLTEARKMIEPIPDHRGLIRRTYRETQTFALRVEQSKMREVQEKLKLDTSISYTLEGLPPHMSEEEVSELLTKLNWPSAKLSEKRTWKRGKACWGVKSATEAPHQTIQLQIGYERFWLRINPAKRRQPTREHVRPAQDSQQPQTWLQAARGVKPKVQFPPADTTHPGDKSMPSGWGKGNGSRPPKSAQSEEEAGERQTKRVRVTGKEGEGQGSASSQPAVPRFHVVPPPTPLSHIDLPKQVETLAQSVARLEQMFRDTISKLSAPQSSDQVTPPAAGGRGGMDVDGGGSQDQDERALRRERSPVRPSPPN